MSVSQRTRKFVFKAMFNWTVGNGKIRIYK